MNFVALSRMALGAFSLLALSGGSAHGDEMTRRVQEELRKRNLYFGDVDGRVSQETGAALRRYQERKGFAPTGAVTPETLGSLGLEGAPEAAPWPELPVLRSDTARGLSEEAREQLEGMAERGELPPIAEATMEPEPKEEPQRPDEKPLPLTEEVERFLRSYLAACETNDLAAEMAFYADRVDYFDHGTVDRAFMEKDIGQRYYKSWPQRRYELLSVRVQPPGAGSEEITLRFRMRFEVKGPKGTAKGGTENTFKLQREPGGALRLVSLRERRVRS